MGKTRWTALLLAVLLLTGCAAGGEIAPRGAAGAAASFAAQPEGEEAGDLTAAEELASPRILTEEEVLAAYYRAEEVCGWFERSPLPDNGEILTIDGIDYRRVDVPGMEKLEDLRTYLRGVFTSELTEQLLAQGDDHPLYREVDGALYVSFTGRSRTQGKGGAALQVNSSSDGGYMVDVNVDLLDENGNVVGLECWSFPYAFVDGRWVFTDFELVY